MMAEENIKITRTSERKLRNIVSSLRRRTLRIKSVVEQPPTPTDLSDEEEADHQDPGRPQELILEDFTESRYASKLSLVDPEQNDKKDCSFRAKLRVSGYIDPRGRLYIGQVKLIMRVSPSFYRISGWLSLITFCFIYNAWAIPLRQFFKHYQTPEHLKIWLFLDYLADLIFLLDLVVVKYRIMIMRNGFWVKDKRELNLLYIKLGVQNTFVRLPRLLKYGAFSELFYRVDAKIRHYQYVLRLLKTILYMLFLIHLNACAYFAISYYEGIGSNSFVYDGVGKNNKPQNTAEIAFMICSWMVGVFFFSILVGNIRDILGTAMKNKNEFRARQSAINSYMNKYKVPKLVQDRVKLWMEFSWEQEKNMDEQKLLSFLPGKMKTDIALRVHYSTLSKVKLFQDCDQGLLKELVTKLRPTIMLPGDYVCRKGDIGREMYIVQSGFVMVMGSPDPVTKTRKILVTLGQGSVFGEIALLGVAGIGRRTADVVSQGFSNLFSLRKEDLEAALRYYPEAKRILNNKARKLIREKTAAEKEQVAQEQTLFAPRQPPRDPAMLEAVMEALPVTSMSRLYLTRGSRASLDLANLKFRTKDIDP